MFVDDPLVIQHTNLSAQLAETIRELGMVRSAIHTSKAEAWAQSAHLAVTERREYMNQCVASLNAEAANLDAEVEALRVELNHVAMLINHF
jgi:hypothetical protein